MPDIFISYSSHDRLQALSLAEKLRASGYDPWIDQHQIHGANRWGKEIVQAINGSQLVAVLISSSSLLSENVVKELNLAAERHKHLLPIMLEDTELTEEFAYHLTGLHQVAIEDSDSILKALEQLKILSASTNTSIRPSANTPAPKDIRLAVLPFDDLSKEHDNEWFADGMLDELITTLGALEHIKVPSRTDVMYYKKHHPKAQEIASDLNVRYLVGGSVRKAGNKIRITSSVTDAFTNQQLWTNTYDGDFDDIFNLQERVSKEITATLKLRLTPEEKKKIEEQPTVNAEAYELYLRGLESQRKFTRKGYEAALEFFEQAISLDPRFIDAFLSIANISCAFYREYSRNPNWIRMGEENLKKAENISGETARTLWIHGEIDWQKGKMETAEQYLKLSIKLDPKHAPAYSMLGNIYFAEGKFKEAADVFEQEITLTNNYHEYYNLLLSISNLGDLERLRIMAEHAILIMEKNLERFPDEITLCVSYIYTLYWADRKEESLKRANLLSKRQDLDAFALYTLGCIYQDLNLHHKHLELLRSSVDSGYRGIESFRNYRFEDPELQKEFEKIIAELEQKIRDEAGSQ